MRRIGGRAAAGVLLSMWVMTSPGSASASPLDALKKANESVRRTVLDNGMICLVKEEHSAPVVAVQIWLGTGSIHEDEMLGAGLAHYMEHMIFKGTPTRGPAEITLAIDEAGGEINAYTWLDRTVFHTDLPSRSWKVGVNVLADAVMNASLPEDEWAREKEVVLREFAMGNDDPDRILGKLLWATAYRVHPYRFPVIGYEDIFRTIDRDDLVAFFRRHYVPDNMMAVVVGDIDAGEVQAYLEKTFAGFKRRARPPAHVPAEPDQMAPRFARKTGPFEVSRLQWAYHTVPLHHPDAPALDVLSAVAGQGRSSRLVREIKERQRLVHEIDAWSFTPRDGGLFGISAVLDPDHESAVIAAIQQEVDRWSRGEFAPDEVEKAKRMLLVSELGSLQTMGGQAASIASGEFYAGSPRFSETYLASIEAVTADTLREVVRRYLRPENRTLVVLAPESAAGAESAAEASQPGGGVSKRTLSNGATLLVREDPRLPFVNIFVALGGGLLTEPAGQNGVTQLMAELLTRGTGARDAEEIALAIENLGASLGSYTGRNSFGLQAHCLADDADAVLAIFSDCLLHPSFPEAEVDKQRTVQLAGIRQQAEQPMFVAQEALRALLFPGHPYRFNPLGTEDTVSGLRREDIAACHERHTVSGNAVFAIFGDITADRAAELAEKHLAALPRGSPPAFPAPATAPALPARREMREPKEQAIVLLGFPGVDVRDPRMDDLSVIQKALSGLSSDLGIEVREKRGLVYYVGAFSHAGPQPGFFALYAGTREEAVAEVEKLMAEELSRIAKGGLRDKEWQRARDQILASHDMSLQSNEELAQTCALNELYGLGYDYGFKLPERLQALSSDRLATTAASLLVPGRSATAILLPSKP
jgi:zinc protease